MSGWRLLIDDGVIASAGLAADECLTGRIGSGASRAALRLYTYRFCALVGRFQNLQSEIRVDYCEARGIPLNRRPTGGGAIVMGPLQLGVALMLPEGAGDGFAQARERMARFAKGLVEGLARLGVNTEFRGKNDLEVEGRKIAGLGIFRHPQGGVLYHASLLVDLDVGEMLRVLNTPFEKIGDKEIATVAARTSTVRKETGDGALTLERVREEMAEGYASAFAVSLRPDGLTAEEAAAVGELEREKYQSPEWVRQAPEVADAFGGARAKTPSGLLDIRVTLAGRMIKAVFVSGDFFAGENAVAALEGALRWHAADSEALSRSVGEVYRQWADGLGGVPQQSLIDTIRAAVVSAAGPEAAGGHGVYGCFVNPQG